MLEQSHHEKGASNPIKGILMLLFSLGAGGTGFYFSQEYIEGQVAQKTVNTTVEEVMVEVVVPGRPLQQGEIVQSSDLLTRPIPQQYVDSNTVRSDNYSLAVGQRMDFNIDKGSPLLWAHLAGGVTPTFSGKVEQGLRAMTVRVDDINSISGFLQPGDRVDLLMSYGKDEHQRILPLIDQLDVIATGLQTEVDKRADGQPRSFSTITVHVSPADAQRLTLAQQVGKLTAILRHPDDQDALQDDPLTIGQLIASANPVPEPKKRTRQLVQAPTIEYIIGGQ